MTLRMDIVSDVVCPWCVIGYHQLAKAAEDTGIRIDLHWHPFELNPDMAQEGENLREHLAAKYGTTPEGSIKARARLTEMGAALGFEFNYADDMRMAHLRAHQLIDWAEDQDRYDMNWRCSRLFSPGAKISTMWKFLPRSPRVLVLIVTRPVQCWKVASALNPSERKTVWRRAASPACPRWSSTASTSSPVRRAKRIIQKSRNSCM